jgi:hypothetical protein
MKSIAQSLTNLEPSPYNNANLDKGLARSTENEFSNFANSSIRNKR